MRRQLGLLIAVAAVICAAAIGGFVLYSVLQVDVRVDPFSQRTLDASGPKDPWGKGVGDLNGDGLPDLVVGGRSDGGLVWYESPRWTRKAIVSHGHFSTDIEIADIDGDGRNDVVAVMVEKLVWFRNLGDGIWAEHLVEKLKLHDIEVADLDGDGILDLVGRNQSAFSGSGGGIHLFFGSLEGNWVHHIIRGPEGEGLKVHDVDGDGRPDIIVNGIWYRSLGANRQGWVAHTYAPDWTWPHVVIDVADFNGDRRVDIVLAPAEPASKRYRMSWFEAPVDRTGPWAEQVIDHDLVTTHHSVAAGDFDLDGRVDVVTAAMHQGPPPREVKLYRKRPDGTWDNQVFATTGSHSLRVADVDGDGDLDVFGANWSGDDQKVNLWLNQRCSPRAPSSGWRRHLIDADRPGMAAFIGAADLDGDGRLDIASGGYWYRNPGRNTGQWFRRPFGRALGDFSTFADIDGNGHIDVFGLGAIDSSDHARVSWVENRDGRRMKPHVGVARGPGDFLQGVVTGRFTRSDRIQIAVSWHESGRGIQLLTPGAAPTEAWSVEQISTFSQDEALSAGDIDRDGRQDLLLGTYWLRNEPAGFRTIRLSNDDASPDRNRLADINGDGRLDAVVGFEAISKAGEVVWYEQGPNPLSEWIRHPVGVLIGPMSLDVADLDGDGDLDIIVGEHNLTDPSAARLVVFLNEDGRGTKWKMQVLATGDEHHDGALAVDVDGDGDIDVVSIGWAHHRVLWYENPAKGCR